VLKAADAAFFIFVKEEKLEEKLKTVE